MEKLTFDSLTIELTRRCNTQCKHCFRGNQQQLDIDKKYINALLDQTEIIGELFFTGGEPTLYIEMMEYILDQLYKRGIPVFKFDFLTNGLEYNDEIVQTIKQYSDMVKLCHSVEEAEPNMEYYVHIGVSIDKYRTEYNPQLAYNYYKEKLKGYAQVRKHAEGNVPQREGFAENLNKAVNDCSNSCENQRVEILTKTIKPLCPQYKTYKLVHENQKTICCPIYLTAKGDITTMALGMHEWSKVDELSQHICKVTDNIYRSILNYNEGKMSCCDALIKQINDNSAWIEMTKNPIYSLVSLFSKKENRLKDALNRVMLSLEDDSEPRQENPNQIIEVVNIPELLQGMNFDNIKKIKYEAATYKY